MHLILNLVLVFAPATRGAIFFIRASVIQEDQHYDDTQVHRFWGKSDSNSMNISHLST